MSAPARRLLEGQVALVTGANRGIGRAAARALAEEGATVGLGARDPEAAQPVIAELVQAGHEVKALRLDVTDAASVEQAVGELEEEYGRIDILVNNAGTTRDGLLLRMRPEDWEVVLDTNLTGVYRVTRAVLRGMVKRRAGRIVNLSSAVGVMGNPGQANYAASKAGILGFTKAVAREVASRGITVNAVAPGLIETDMTRGLPEAARQALLERVPLGRAGAPEEVARCVVFLASPWASYITGEVLHVGGGLYM
ncbi:MAG: 3-oxoacyl-ACP reductase FabG [Nitrospinota bacterium]